MKRNIALLAIFAAIISMSACRDMDASNMPYMEQMRDSIFKNYPTVASITIKVEESSVLHVILGDAHLYKANAAEQQKVANGIGILALHLFNKDNALDKGQMTVTKNERNEDPNPADGITVDINLDSLRRISPEPVK